MLSVRRLSQQTQHLLATGKRHFPRASNLSQRVTKPVSISERLENAKSKEDKQASLIDDYLREQAYREQAEEFPPRVEDTHNTEYKEVSELALPIDRIPSDILTRANKVFSKHNAREVREWAQNMIKSYQLLHAIEKPINFDYVKPYANTSDLKNKMPNIDHNQAFEKVSQRIRKAQ